MVKIWVVKLFFNLLSGDQNDEEAKLRLAIQAQIEMDKRLKERDIPGQADKEPTGSAEGKRRLIMKSLWKD